MKIQITKKSICIILLIISFILLETFFYEAAKWISSDVHVLHSVVDDKIPFTPIFIYPYVSWYLLLFLVPLLIYKFSKEDFYKYTLSLIATILISFIIFVLYPTTVIRPEIEVTGLTTWLLNKIYLLDTPALCCLPSMHCALCFLFIIYITKLKNMNIVLKVCVTVISTLIILSTLFIKQHVIYDVLLSLIITLSVFLIFEKTKIYIKTQKFIERRIN
ncbi:MAG: phosphatase PAP2 family protein [Clostridia bacterium]|nr:phosphatase PAP2 family protein [Clostridia bacterium]